MNYRYLGRTGLKVSELCLGSMTFGREHEATGAESHETLERFVAAGGNFVNTANVYSQGVSEEIFGRWLEQQRREDLVIATKVRFPIGDGPNDAGLSRKHLLASVAESLRRLKTDYIDLYQIHCWDAQTPLEETLSTLDELVRRGWVRYLGVSNFSGWQLQKALELAKQHGWETFVSLEPQYNLLRRSTEWELIPVRSWESPPRARCAVAGFRASSAAVWTHPVRVPVPASSEPKSRAGANRGAPTTTNTPGGSSTPFSKSLERSIKNPHRSPSTGPCNAPGSRRR